MKRQIIKKWFWVWDFDKEEKWLNEMAQSGWVLDKVGFCKYEFVRCEAGEYSVRLEMLEDAATAEKSQDYITFVEDLGAEYIGSVIKWVYFRKKTADGEFDLFSDNESRIKHLNRVLTFIGLVGAANLVIGANNIMLYFINRIGISLIGILNVLLAVLSAFGFHRLWKKKKVITGCLVQVILWERWMMYIV
jgi:hypothetical protein